MICNIINMTDQPSKRNNIARNNIAQPRNNVAQSESSLHSLQQTLLGLAEQAVKTLEEIMASGEKGDLVRLNAAKTILDRVGIIPPKAKDPDRRRGLEDMSRDDLHKVIQEAERVLGDRATPVAPVSQAYTSDIID